MLRLSYRRSTRSPGRVLHRLGSPTDSPTGKVSVLSYARSRAIDRRQPLALDELYGIAGARLGPDIDIPRVVGRSQNVATDPASMSRTDAA